MQSETFHTSAPQLGPFHLIQVLYFMSRPSAPCLNPLINNQEPHLLCTQRKTEKMHAALLMEQLGFIKTNKPHVDFMNILETLQIVSKLN